MSSSKVIYVNDDDMIGGMFNNETKPVNTPEHTPEHTQMMTPTISEQTGGGESTMKPLTPMVVPQLAPLQPVTIQHTAMVQQQQPTTVQQNTLEAMPVMTGGKKKKKKKNDNADDDNAANDSNADELNESESWTDESDTGESSQHDDDSDTSSICTEQLLTFDPMYIKLTKFLYTSGPDGKSGRNITQVLEGIEKQMEKLADALQKSTLMSMSSTETN